MQNDLFIFIDMLFLKDVFYLNELKDFNYSRKNTKFKINNKKRKINCINY